MALSGSARAMKSKLINSKGYTPENAMAYLIEHGYIKVDPAKTKRSNKIKPDAPAETPDAQDQNIDPKHLLQRAINQWNGDPKNLKTILESIPIAAQLDLSKTPPKPPWVRPPILSKKQNEIIDAICDESTSVVFIEGSRRTGKSTSVWVAAHETIWNGTRHHIGFWAATEQTAIKIHNDMYSDKLTFAETTKLLSSHTQKRSQILDGDFTVNADTLSASSGKAFDMIWIDEFHNVLKENPKVVAVVAGILRSEPRLKLILSCNQEQGVYQMFKDLLQPLIDSGKVKFFTLLKEDATVDQKQTLDKNDEIVDILMKASMGDQFADMQLRNIQSTEGDQFNGRTLRLAFEMYDKAVPLLKPDLPEKVFLAIDPSGVGHAFGWFLGGIVGTHAFEIDSGELHMGDGVAGQTLTPERLNEFFIRMCHEHAAKAVLESNTYGPALKIALEQNNVPCDYSNFGADTANTSRAAYIAVARDLVDKNLIYLKNKALYRQLLIYNPKKSTDETYKGNIADAFLHFCWASGGGLNHSKAPQGAMQPQENKQFWS